MNKALRVSLGVCALVALSVVAEAQSKQKCGEIIGSGGLIFQDEATAKSDLKQKIDLLKQKTQGKVTIKGGVKSTCSDFGDCKVRQKVCIPTGKLPKPTDEGGVCEVVPWLCG